MVSIIEDGKFELNLRDEYQFAWEDDSVDMYFTDTDGKVYNFHYTENGTAKTVDLNLLNLLYTLVGNDTPIVLTEE